MRVIAGTCRSLPLKTLPGKDTRPTTDRIKETLFNMIQDEIPGCRFLDLFAGSGAIGIEALSRGAEYCVFVDKSRQAVQVIRENLRFTKLEDRSQVLSMEASSAIRHLDGNGSFDIVFIDPPYENGLEKDVLAAFLSSGCVHPDTLYIVEASLRTDFAWLADTPYECIRTKNYKTNKHLFIRKQS